MASVDRYCSENGSSGWVASPRVRRRIAPLLLGDVLVQGAVGASFQELYSYGAVATGGSTF